MRSRIELRKFLAGATFLLALAGIGCETKETATFKPEVLPLPTPLTRYEAMEVPADNPQTPEKAALGRQLFFDKRLSGDETRSCYSCHVCEKGLTDGLPKAIGAFNKALPRSSPTLWNIGYQKMFYWDGRSPSLEKQAMAAWQGGNMGAKDHETEIVAKINGLAGYHSQFQKVFGGDATAENIMQAISAFERTIISGDTAWDRWQNGDQSAASEAAKRGFEVFKTAKCTNCHDGVLVTDQQFHNVGVGMDASEPDKGRFNATKKDEDTGAFKTPTLRDVAKSAPYFHDGSAATLEQAVDVMAAGGISNPYLDAGLAPVKLSERERAALLSFLRSLTAEETIQAPALPP